VNLRAVKPELREIPVGLLDEPRLISRIAVKAENVEYLAGQMRQFGFTSAILVARMEDRYEVIAGHHRMLAARLAGIPAVPALVYPSYLDGIEALQHTENADRFPTTAADEAVWFAQLLEAHADEGTDGLAARVSKTRAYVEGRLSLLAGDQQVFAALSEETISIGVAQQLNRCTDEQHRRYLLDLALRVGATVATVSGWIHEWKTVHAPATAGAPAVESVSAGGPVLSNDYFRCRLCGERDNTANMQPVNAHDYCLRAAIDPATGLFRSKADYVEFPRTRDAALQLVQRVLDRFPELADESAARA
jgi:ParB/RepB/Spo0J family partition protein